MTRKLTKEEFIRKAKEKHKGKNYGYDNVKYKNNKTKVKITCLNHGDFDQLPSSHLSGNGCPDCAVSNQSSTAEKFISEARKVHRDKYCYHKVDYINSQTKVKITCLEHGDFKQTPTSHLSGHGCLKCRKTRKSNTEKFISDARKVHRDKYGYEEVDYISAHIKIKITCFEPEHDVFEQTPNHHLQGQGCPKCGGTRKSNTEDFIFNSKKVHGNKYNYDKVDYNDSETKVEITCIKHGEFKQVPSSHLRGRGCPKCNSTGYSKVSVSFLETFPYNIIHAKNEGEKIIETKKKKYKADGYFKASKSEEIDDIFRHCHHDCLFRFRNPNSLEVVIEFHGCFWHGCEMCYTERDEINSVSDKTFEELYKATNRKKMRLIKAGYNYIEIWECQYKTLIEG